MCGIRLKCLHICFFFATFAKFCGLKREDVVNKSLQNTMLGIIINPKSGKRAFRAQRLYLWKLLKARRQPFIYRVTKYANHAIELARELVEEKGCTQILVLGGDGTLSEVINGIMRANLTAEQRANIQFGLMPRGTGNDFAKDLGKDGWGKPFSITKYIKNLPSVEVKGKTYRFINGVGFGIDGYCCQVGDELKKIPGKKVNYAGIAIKGLLFSFAPRNAKVTVDGKEYTYRKVWIAPTMCGRYYGGGMIPAPLQRRTDPERKLSVTIFGGAGRLRTLCVFPSIFKGEHVKHTKQVAVHTGHEITVTFDRPTPLQIDGETIVGVKSYRALSKLPAKVNV